MACGEFLKRKFGIEVELTGITRTQAAKIVKEHFGGTIHKEHDYYDTHKITAPDGEFGKSPTTEALKPKSG